MLWVMKKEQFDAEATRETPKMGCIIDAGDLQQTASRTTKKINNKIILAIDASMTNRNGLNLVPATHAPTA